MITMSSIEKIEQHMFSNNESENLISQSANSIRHTAVSIKTDHIIFFMFADECNQSESESDSI